MALVFETIPSPGIAALSYLVGDDAAGVAAVFDPTVESEKYLAIAREKQVSITHVFETHIHADFVSGARQLCERAGSARVHVSHEGGGRYGFVHEALNDGDRFLFGETAVVVRHTPGHTPEHVSYQLEQTQHPGSPWGVITGDSLFVGSAGRPDLMGSGETEKLTRKLFDTLRGFYLTLPDGVMIFPAHGHGSPCGADISDRPVSTIGHERKFNPYLQFTEYEAFRDHALSDAPPVPTYYPRMKKINARGPEIAERLPTVPALPPETFSAALEKDAGVLIDTRTMLGFGGGHIPGALNLGGLPMLSIWAGWLLEPDEPLLLVLDGDEKLAEVVTLFLRTGYTRFAGYLAGGMTAWSHAGKDLARVTQMTVHELHARDSGLQILDVRSPGEWEKGHVPGASHCFLPELRKRCATWDKRLPIAVYCDSGYRASIGTSILKQEGFDDVRNVPGSWQAWQQAGLPVDMTSSPTKE
jgi:hydroxyacylglutathione hydrolase